jgi:hypothetical protein
VVDLFGRRGEVVRRSGVLGHRAQKHQDERGTVRARKRRKRRTRRTRRTRRMRMRMRTRTRGPTLGEGRWAAPFRLASSGADDSFNPCMVHAFARRMAIRTS